ncbi:MAG TPA: Ig-like domain-containing protein, partial [Thermoanaerobaculia bacterium]|nr:Ig-like domain-containing protein [Thermoanaerobaculia bacterium]
VDATSGELLSFGDLNLYESAKIQGGIFPVSNDGRAPDGVEQPAYPMPFAEVVQPFGGGTTTNSAGLVSGIGSTLRTRLAGPYVRIHDFCGPIDEVALCSDLDLDFGAGTDCVVPPGHSAGDTHAARSAFYELNRQIEGARGLLPGNAWLSEQITANMNLDDVCNAFWDGATVNFFKSGSGCANTGEIAAVFDHEWGHGLDDNDTNGEISSPGESIADIYGILRVADSCFGRGFIPGVTECAGLVDGLGGYGDQCLDCSGVRELDYEKHESGLPHDLGWVLSPLATPDRGGCVGVPPLGVQFGPCNQETHCEGMVAAEVGWDLFARDLQAPPFSYDHNTALETARRIVYSGAGPIGGWYQCVMPDPATGEQLAGCNADGGYLNLLAVDDDNGDLADGTPHMAALYGAFARHQIACSTPAPPPPGTPSGCAGAPTSAPDVTVTPGEQSATIAWGAVDGAASYRVFRSEGVMECQFGKTLLAETSGTSFTDPGLRDGFDYFYSVQAVGANGACAGPMSPCAGAVPLPKPPESDAVLAFREVAGAFAIVTGDGDDFLDNCEVAQLSFEVENGGSVDLFDVELVRVESTSHPETRLVTPLPVRLADLLVGGACGAAETRARASFAFQPEGLEPDETLEFEFEVRATSVELGPIVLVGRERVAGTESDFQYFPTKTFSFESGLEGWRIVSGTYTAQAPGAAGTATHLASSAFTASQCDEIQSPQLRLGVGSTLALYDQWSTEPGLPVQGSFDRANVGIFDELSGLRTTVAPDGGRTYNVSGPNGACVTQGQPGWAGAGPGFVASNWSATALGVSDGGGAAGRRVRLDVAYGTDPLVEASGFQFDEVTITDFDLQVADTQGDSCSAPPAIVANDDAAGTTADTAVAIDVLSNDFTVSPPLQLVAIGDPPSGSAADNGDGTLSYAPDPGFTGTDSFTYTAQDGAGRQATATVTVEVTGLVGPPSPCDPPGVEVASDPAGDAAAIAAGDPSLDLRSLSIAEPFLGAGAEKLVVTLEVADFALPHPSAAWRVRWASPDGTTYFVSIESCDATAGLTCSYGTFDGTFYTSEGSVACATDPSGALEMTVDKALVGIDDATDAGKFLNGLTGVSQVFIGALCTGGLSQADATSGASYAIQTNASCGDGTPVAGDDTASTVMNGSVEIDVLANDIDPDGQLLAIENVTDPVHGTVVHDGASVTYAPDLGFLGADGFAYDACDPDGLCDTGTVVVEVRCPAQPGGGFDDDFEPDATPGWQVQTATNQNPASLPWGVAIDPFAQSPTNSVRSDATTLQVKDDRLLSPPQNLSATSRLAFWHRFAFEGGFDGGVLEVSRDGGASWIDVVTGGGVFVEGSYNGILSTTSGSPIPGRAAWTGFSTFVDAMERVEVDLGAFAGEGVRVRWRLAADALAPGALPGLGWWIDDVTFTDTLEIPGSCPLPPEAEDDTATTTSGVAVTIDVLANDRDPNADELVVGRADAASANGGTVTNNGNDVTYAPAAGFAGTDRFTYDACDPGGLCDSATVTVEVEATTGATTVSGGGWIVSGSGKAHLSVNADADANPKGRINYSAPGGFKAKGPVTALAFPSANSADLSGSCELANGAPCTFSLTVEDLSSAGGRDRFSIQVRNGLGSVVHSAAGELGGGDYQIE